MRPKSLLRRRPSAATVIAALALFVSLGGVGYAATLGNGSVGTAQLKNGAVTNSKLKNNSVSFRKIVPGSVGIVRADTNQLQVRVSGKCNPGQAIGTIESNGKVGCNSALPSQTGTTNNTATVTSSPATVDSATLATGSSYLALANPTVTVAGTGVAQRVDVSCRLTVGSNTESRSVTINTGSATTETSSSIPLMQTGPGGTASVTCQTTNASTPAPAVNVTSALQALQVAG
jgi:hypothetical protein